MSCARLTLALLVAAVLAACALFLGVFLAISDPAGLHVARGLFVLTLAVELLAFGLALAERARFRSGEPNRRIWTLFALFLGVRLLAQLRLATLYFGLLPESVLRAPFYTDALRYLYTVSDLCFTAALIVTIRGWRATGLPFRTLGRDYALMLLVSLLAICTWALAGNLTFLSEEFRDLAGHQMQIFRLVAVTLGTLVACLCLVVRRFAVQMGGGALAGVWTAVVVAGIAHAASFLVVGALSQSWKTGSEFFEQLCLFVFAGSFMLAILRQRELGLAGRTPA